MIFFGVSKTYRALSSAVEHLVYTEGVGSSILSAPTILLLIKSQKNTLEHIRSRVF